MQARQRCWYVALSLGLLCACDNFDTSYGDSCPPGDYPRCSAEGLRQECREDWLDEFPCPSGTVCLSGFYSNGDKWAECARRGAVLCDVEVDPPTCDEGGYWTCSEAGYTSFTTCPDDEVCVDAAVGPTCADPAARSCDPATFETSCEAGQVAWCDQGSGVVVFEACRMDEVCEVGVLGPTCVDVGAVPCDPEVMDKHCEGEVIVDCTGSTGFTSRRPCAFDERCREGSYGVSCFGPDQPDCDADTFVERCDSNVQISCGTYGVEQGWGCGSDVCRVNALGAHCVDADAEPCDRAVFLQRCEDGLVLACGYSGFTDSYACSDDRICTTTPVLGLCADPGAEVCDPADYQESCIGEEWLACDRNGLVQRGTCEAPVTCRVSPLGAACVDPDAQTCDQPYISLRCDADAVVYCGSNGFETSYDCEVDQVCVEGDMRYLEWPLFAACLDAATPTCDGSVPLACDGSAATLCFGGREVSEDCGESVACVSDGEQWTCAPLDAPTCDAASHTPSCAGAVLRDCFGEPGVELDVYCLSESCIDDIDGARCGSWVSGWRSALPDRS